MIKAGKTVYLDHAATTPTDPRIGRLMASAERKYWANASTLYAMGTAARSALDGARSQAAAVLRAHPDEIVFTSGGTEGDNAAIFGIAKKQKSKKAKHIITTAVEHHAVLEPMRQLEREGFAVTYVPVDERGIVSVENIKKALRPETILVSAMYANNEIGSIQPIAEIGKMLLKWRKEQGSAYPYFHVDACQAPNYLSLNVEQLHADLLVLNGSKIYGPHGSGVLFKRRGVEFEPIMYGGGQEFGLRPGTEDVVRAVGFSEALASAVAMQEKEMKRMAELQDYFWKEIQKKIDGVKLNGPVIARSEVRATKQSKIASLPATVARNDRLPNNLNVSFKGCDAEALILYLDAQGIQCSTGSACTTDSLEPSHVLKACGYSEERAKSSVRFTLGRSTTKKDIDYVLKVLPGIVEKVRIMSQTSV